jgi:putative NIF3 family GTP cyclohydrolase 1 type 2
MNRRDFLYIAGANSLSLALAKNVFAETDSTPVKKENLTAKDLNDYLRSLWKVSEPSVDRIIIGDPDTVVKKIGTCWMPDWETCRKAVEKGVNVLVAHEPTFYTQWDLEGKKDDFLSVGSVLKEDYLRHRDKKVKWINDAGLVIIRCHDVWDTISKCGIPYALGKVLEFSNDDIIRSRTYYNVYKITPKPAIEVAKHIAERLKSLNQPGVAFYGDENYMVSSVGVGTGWMSDPLIYGDLKPDLYIAIDDVIRTWVQTVYAQETGQPLVVINHGTTEEPGIRLLNAHLDKVFTEIEVVHFYQGCGYKWITV